MERLTFKQYLESKDQLIKAVHNTPISIAEYEVKKYCSIAVGDTDEERQLIGLKPKNRVVVEWHYPTPDTPTPDKVWVKGVKGVDEDQDLSTFWSGTKLSKWLTRHTNQG